MIAEQSTAPATEAQNAPALFNRAQIARHINVSERTIGAMMVDRQIPHIRIRGRVLFDPVAVTAHLAKTAAVAAVR